MQRSLFSGTLLALGVLGGTLSSHVRAGGVCEHWLAGSLVDQPEGVPSGSGISCSIVWSPPGHPPMLVIGGAFMTAGGVTCRSLAAWDGASWRDLGGTILTGSTNGVVHALAVYNGDLIIAGMFDSAGGVPATNIARFDGTTWHALAGPNGEGLTETPDPPFVTLGLALTVYNGELIAGGHFARAGGLAASNIARWNGSQWNAMGFGIHDVGRVYALAVHNSVLFIGGYFDFAGGVPAANIAQYINSSYFALGAPGNGTGGNTPGVNALRSFGNDLIIGGNFISAGGLSAPHVARWTPSGGSGSTAGTWGTLGAGLPGIVSSFSIYPVTGQLVAGGGGNGNVQRWNGSTWSAVGAGVSGGVGTLEVFGGQLVAAGLFNTAGSPAVTATNIAQFNGTVWSSLDSPVTEVYALETLAGRVIAGGSFTQSTTSQPAAHNLVGWNGSTLTQVTGGTCCEGTNAIVRALKTIPGNSLIVGGDFTTAAGLSANRIAMYTEPLTGGATWSGMGSGFNNRVWAIDRTSDGAIFAGGEFTAAGTGSPTFNRFARWTGLAWAGLDAGVNGTVRALQATTTGSFPNIIPAVVVGGEFTTANGAAANRVAMWKNGDDHATQGWVTMGSGFNNTVFALEGHGGSIYAGGAFTASGATTLNRIARWNGSAWVAVGTGGASGGFNGLVLALRSDGPNLYAAGNFTSVDGVATGRLAKWNGTTWQAVPTGPEASIFALTSFQSEIVAGGVFNTVGNPPLASRALGRYSESGVPWLMQQPASLFLDCGDNVMFSVEAADGYNIAYAWRKDGDPLSDGPTVDGSIISGATTPSLSINNIGNADAGAYDCTLTTACGSATSNAATLTVKGACPEPCVGDITGDSVVNIDDLLAVIGAWGPCPTPPTPCLADVAPAGGNGVVNIDDLLAVIGGWGACP